MQRLGKSDSGVMAGLFGLFLLLNLFTGSRYPIVPIDEVLYTDPAANLYFGRGFNSTAWFAQTDKELWAGNVPLHQLLLAQWFKVFGFSLMSVRSFNYFLMAASAALIWWTLARLRVSGPLVTAFVIVPILFGTGTSFSYRMGRPDMIGLLLCSAVFATWVIPFTRVRFLALTALGALLPVAGLQVAVFIIVLNAVALFFFRPRIWKESIAIMVGISLGTIALLSFYAFHGVLDDFRNSVFAITGRQTLPQRLGSIFRAFFDPANVLSTDFTRLLLLIFGVVLLIQSWLHGNRRALFYTSLGLIAGIAVPSASAFAGAYPLYYSWSSVMPLSICLGVALDATTFNGRSQALTLIVIAAVFFLGLPLRLAVAFAEWQDRDYARVEKLVEAQVKTSDVVYTDFEGYFPVKRLAARCILPGYLLPRPLWPLREKPYQNLDYLPDEERKNINVMVLNPRFAYDALSRIDGRWQPVGEPLQPQKTQFAAFRWKLRSRNMPYQLQVYRRDPVP